MKLARRLSAKLVLLAGALVFSFGLAELLLRWLTPAALPDTRAMYVWSSPVMRYWPDGSVRMGLAANLRMAAIAHGKAVYDDMHCVNRQGFLDCIDYADITAPVRVAFAGDSVMAGQGAPPWFPGLREQSKTLPDVALFNLGVPGAGVQQYVDLARRTRKEFGWTHVVLPVFCDNFHRRPWVPVERDRLLWFCPQQDFDPLRGCSGTEQPVGALAASNAGLPELISAAGRLRAVLDQSSAPGRPITPAPGLKGVARQLIAYSAVLQALNRVRSGVHQRELLRKLELDNIRAARDLSAELGDGRVELWWWSPDTELPGAEPACRTLKNSLRVEPYFRDIASSCGLNLSDVHAADPHVNPAGYRKLTNCFSTALNNMLQAKP